MSTRWPGGIISGTAPVPTGGGAQDTAPGVWTLEQADQYIATQEWPGTGIPDPQFQYVTALLHGDGTNAGQNNTFIDSSSNNFTITRNGNTTQGSFSPYGDLWSNFFDGTGDYLSAAANTAFEMGSGDFTIECWVFLTSYGPSNNNGTIFSKGLVGGVGTEIYSFQVNQNDGKLYFYSGNYTGTSSPVVVSPSAVTLNVWNHFAVTRSGSTTTLWINGYSVNTNNAWTSQPTGGGIYIGTQWFDPGNSARSTYGYISNLRFVKGTAVYTSTFTPSTSPLTAISGTSLLTCQSNRFIDNSTNNFTLTVNGTPSVQRFSPFQNLATYTPARVGGSGYFDGTGDYLTVADNAALNVGTGDFCLECWFNRPAVASGTDSDIIVAKGTNNFVLAINPSAIIQFAQYGVALLLSSTSTATLNSWFHVAVTRSGTTLRMFINGVQEASATNSTNFTSTTALHIGLDPLNGNQKFNGYISNLRLVKGSAVYTSNFTPSATPLTNITNTSLLCNFTNAAIFDSDASNDLETVGNAQISTSVVKYGTGSLAFDGSGDWLISRYPTGDLTAFGTGNFTIEMWVYFNNAATNPEQIFLDFRPGGGNQISPMFYVLSGTVRYYVNGSDRITSGSISSGQWYHLAVCRAGTSTKMFINGLETGGTYTDSNNYISGANRPYIGASQANANAFSGYIDDLRITKGYARYWYNFQPPTRAFPNYGGTVIEMEDPLFEYNTLLLNGDGANGGQNNTFLDSSTNNFTITRNGNTTQGSFSPYGTLWSNFFNGSSSLDIADSSEFVLGNNFTIECWVNFSTTSGIQQFINQRTSSSNAWQFLYGFPNSNDLTFKFEDGNVPINRTWTPIVGQWYHIAVTRSSNTWYLFVNGSQLGATATNSTSFPDIASPVRIGALQNPTTEYFSGYLSNIRVVKSSVYTSNFTPSTTPLTAITNTVLLTCQSNRFIDNSSNNFTLTVNGTPSVQRFSPFEPSAPYSTSVIGGSGYFDGSGDYLQTPSDAAFGYGTGDFSLEFWAYPDSASVFNRCIFHTDDAFNLELNSGQLMFFQFPTAYLGGTYRARSWVHCCVTRVGTTARMFVDGVLVNNFTFTATKGNSAVQIGANVGSSQFLNGYLSNVRIVKGGIPSAYLTSSTTNGTQVFTPQTTPFTGSEALTGGSVSLLLNTTNAAIPDRAMQNDLETVGNAQISTSVVKYGTGSIAFDGTGDYLRVPYSKAFAFAGDFTVEFWINYSAHETFGGLVACASSTNPTTGWQLIFNNAADTLLFQASSSFSITTSTALPRNQWNHVAVARNGSSVVIYINGLVAGSGTSSSVFDSGSFPLYVAAERTPLFSFTGYMDDLRITNGIARYVQPFTPPTAALPTY